MKHLLVTGGAGFIGSNFITYLLNTAPDITIVNLDLLTYGQYILGKPANGLGNRAIYQPAAS